MDNTTGNASPTHHEPDLATYAQSAYLEYALSVVKGRALPDVCDGQKPVQRRILYAMARMGLGFSSTSTHAQAAKAVKCARVVGDVLGKFHPHSDQAAYDALVRMAQDFSQRYPLVDGQGNFGSRDGDGAAAMRYTEARLSRISGLLMAEIDMETVAFSDNYDSSTTEPLQLPARLPFVLLNGASGIAVGLATEIPSHNLTEVANACIAMVNDLALTDDEILQYIKGPDYAGGAQIISNVTEIAQAYKTGKGTLKVRARWHIEELARGQWQCVVDELPHNVSTQKILEELEDITNPKIKIGKKTLTPEQVQLKASVLAVLDGVRDESNKDAAVRLVIDPKNSKIGTDELMATLLAHTSLESTSSINLTVVGWDGRPTCKSLRQILWEWVQFRQRTILQRSRHLQNKTQARIHILEGRVLVLLHIDEVIAIIRHNDEPHACLVERFSLSDTQAHDILDIKLRQLARLESIKIEQELQNLQTESNKLDTILNNPQALKRLMCKEIEADAKQFGDARRTLLQADKKTILENKVTNEPVTLVISQQGWVRTKAGHGHDDNSWIFKTGDALLVTLACRSVDFWLAIGNNGRVYSVPVAQLPNSRGDGLPFSSFIDIELGTHLMHHFTGALSNSKPAATSTSVQAPQPQSLWLLSNTAGFGFLTTTEAMLSRMKSGKAFMTCNPDEAPCSPMAVEANMQHIACASNQGRFLVFDVADLKNMTGGGRGLLLLSMDSQAEERLVGAVGYASTDCVILEGTGRGGKTKQEILEMRSLTNAKGVRGRKGKMLSLAFKIQKITAGLSHKNNAIPATNTTTASKKLA